MSTIDRKFFDRPVLEVARDLLGQTLVHEGPGGRVAVRLTEVEAYDGPDDPGSHAFRGRTARNATMFGPPGHVYVYFTYGMYYCANLVCGPVGRPSGVLLRAGEVAPDGIGLARSRRPSATADRDLARGPARLVMALGLGPEYDGADACGDGPITLVRTESGRKRAGADAEQADPVIRTGPRVGLSAAADWPWRFWLDGEPTVSVYRPAKPRGARVRTAAGDAEPVGPIGPAIADLADPAAPIAPARKST
ncbi:MAG TPA: DNA-3-methyladenine glycosylase [Actinocrinis sp.]|nr:DNA-3-methyladenine glycosylase [Actinocrinis sp.]